MTSAVQNTKRTKPAIQRAARRWLCVTAVFVRGELRAQGVGGPMKLLDTYASGERGKAAPDQLATFVRYARDNGMSEPDVQVALRQMVDGLTSDVYAEPRDRRETDRRA